MIEGIIIGIVIAVFFFIQMNPCRHEETYHVMKCKRCSKIVGDIGR